MRESEISFVHTATVHVSLFQPLHTLLFAHIRNNGRFLLDPTSKCTDLARPRSGGVPFAAERCADRRVPLLRVPVFVPLVYR